MMSSLLIPPSSSCSLFSDTRDLHSLKPLSATARFGSKSSSTICCSSRRYDIPKLEPFSRTKFDRILQDLPLIQKTENQLTDYCTTLEGDECYSCWVAYKELRELQKEEPEKEVKKIIEEAYGMKSLIGHLHRTTEIMRRNKEERESVKAKQPLNEDLTAKPTMPLNNAENERPKPFPVPDGLPRPAEEVEEEEKARMPDSPYTILLRSKGKFPAWYTPRPDHETD